MSPKEWDLLNLGELAQYVTSGSRGWAKYYSDQGSAFLRVQNIRRGSTNLDWSDVQCVSPPLGAEGARTKLQKNDILVTITADLGRIGLFNSSKEAYVNQHVALVRLNKSVYAPFVSRYLITESAQHQLGLRDRGVTRAGLGLDDIKAVKIPLAPIAEQRRIVAKLDSLTGRLARARTELKRVSTMSNRLRQISLKAAFSGELTSDFHADPTKICQPKLDDQERGIWRSTELPQNWRWVSFADFFKDCTDSTRKLPQIEYLREGLYPVIDQGKKFIGGFSNDEKLLHQAELPTLVFGDHTRCVKFVDKPFIQGADGVKVFIPSMGVMPRFAYYALAAVELPAKGYSRHAKFVRRTIWPLPPLEEQKVIVDRLNLAFARINHLEAQATRVQVLVDRLEDLIYTKAFQGKLLTQNEFEEFDAVSSNHAQIS